MCADQEWLRTENGFDPSAWISLPFRILGSKPVGLRPVAKNVDLHFGHCLKSCNLMQIIVVGAHRS